MYPRLCPLASLGRSNFISFSSPVLQEGSSVLHFSQASPMVRLCLCKDRSHEVSAIWIGDSSIFNFVLLTSFLLYCPQVVPCLGGVCLSRGAATQAMGNQAGSICPMLNLQCAFYTLQAGAVLYSLTSELCWVVVSSLQLR